MPFKAYPLSMLAILLLIATVPVVSAQVFRGGAVGGIHIDPRGAVSAPEVDDQPQLLATWRTGLAPVPGELQRYAELRFVSLKRIEAEIAQHRLKGTPLPDAVRYLAGLLRVQYILVYPDRGDIVLAGPAEGWKVDSLGNTVGATSGRPVLMLEDLIVAFRSSRQPGGPVLSCSIDPTEEGLRRVQQVARQLVSKRGPQFAAREIEQALGPQVVSVQGVPTTSHFARTMVAADFRMKRLAMNFESAPVDGLPSYLQMLSARGAGMQNMLPRWWLATNYQPVLRDKSGHAWQIRGQGVQCKTEEDFVSQRGERQQTGGANAKAQQWADRLTERFNDLANHDSAFGHLRNVMDEAVAAAIITKEGLLEYVSLEMPWLLEKYELEEYSAPRSVASQASFIKKRGGWIISASGGVEMRPWEVAERTETSNALGSVHQRAAAGSGENWWWE